jgi:tetratricopeptide (TPR) repeat protein
MGLLTFFRPFKDPEFPPGTVFYVAAAGEYAVYKILRFEKEGLFVRAYWPDLAIPTAESWRELDLRNACEAFDVAALEHAVVLTNEAVSDEDEKSYVEFQRIEEGIRRRAERMETLQKEAASLTEQGRLEEAVALYTEAASFSKYYFQTFAGRGYCYLKLGRYTEAIVDLEHALDIFPEGKETILHCAEAYRLSGNEAKAEEKLVMLAKPDQNPS